MEVSTMSFKHTKLPNEPIVAFQAGADYDAQKEMEATMSEANAIFDTLASPSYLILDFSLTSMSIHDIVVGANASARGDNAPLHHPKIKQIVFVTRDKAMKMSAAGLGGKVFGELQVPVFDKYEDALTFVRTLITQA